MAIIAAAAASQVMTATLAWDAPQDGLAGYEIQWSVVGEELSDPIQTTDTQHTLGGILPNTRYHFEVRSVAVGGLTSIPATLDWLSPPNPPGNLRIKVTVTIEVEQ